MPTELRAVVVSRYGQSVLDAFCEGLRSEYGGRVSIQISATLPTGPDVVAVAVAPPTRFTAGDLAALPDLRVVVAVSSGVDHIATALPAAAGTGVVAAFTPGYCDVEVADHTITSAAMLLRAIARGEQALRAGTWDSRATGARRVTGARLGIAGLGRIGTLVLARALALGMSAAVWAPRTPSPVVRELGGEPYESLETMLAEVDVVTLHVPMTDATRGLIGAQQLAAMRPGSYLINTGRGELIDFDALRAALESGHLAGAALDAFDVEPLPADHPARGLPNTVLTPHMAWISPEAEYEAYRMAGRAVAAVLDGGKPEHLLA
ncbi:NAD(P)-binding domain-containing protein [Jatrophihabitans cynanchi]|uniref:NAD(P)-binding domain-containing protein n=1 Tax=Jatrophihabitans cynanchi TaxID=2944128 RepID=A0ABY7K6P0_9ACTN|nr:NAD(P)-dependent oxidoreductase [Jatrophihabitans sp. SB3-54]WAX58979.1 NAD(P)-binding domain-containing protein [Jatrophihabitans sp. SB3-54]